MTANTSQFRLSGCREATPGVIPTNPRMRRLRITSHGLRFETQYENSEEIRDDRSEGDPIKISEENDGTLGCEVHYPADRSLLSEIYQSAFYNDWVNTPSHDNDGTAGASITQIAGVNGDVLIVDESGGGGFSPTAYKAGHLVRFSGFAAPGNNILSRVVSSAATKVTFGAAAFPTDNAPGASARLKVVGFEGATGDIRAVAAGFTSTVLDFTTLGLAVGQWIKIGATGDAYRFATAANNAWVRVAAIAANALTLSHLPSGWAADTAAAKTIRVFFGDYIRDGSKWRSVVLEAGFMSQDTPTYVAHPGMTATQLEWNLEKKRKLTQTFTFMGTDGPKQGPTSLDTIPDASPNDIDYPVFQAGPNVGRVAEAGAELAAPNFVQKLVVNLNNNGGTVDDVRLYGAAAIRPGSATVSGSIDVLFGDATLYTKATTGQRTSVGTVVKKGSQAMCWFLPRVTYQGFPTNPARNQDSILSLQMRMSKDPILGFQVQFDRLEYVEA